jgi:hypothetical protein
LHKVSQVPKWIACKRPSISVLRRTRGSTKILEFPNELHGAEVHVTGLGPMLQGVYELDNVGGSVFDAYKTPMILFLVDPARV